MNRIVVIGSSNIDMIIHCDRLPVQGQIVAGRQFAMKPAARVPIRPSPWPAWAAAWRS